VAKSGPRPGSGPDGRTARAAESRAALIAAAIEALREVGFAAASPREIAGRAGCNQALIFYHFGSVTDLMLAALDDISARRMAAYRELIEGSRTPAELIDSARVIFLEDLDAGHVSVLAELITASHAMPGLGEQVAARLAPWREVTEAAVRRGLDASPIGALLPAPEIAHAVMAGILGLEMLAHVDGDRSAALAMFDRARQLAALLDLAGRSGLASLIDLAGLTRLAHGPGKESSR
jgi:AcrR family transcriptional regulator